jgi:hypothetical protein
MIHPSHVATTFAEPVSSGPGAAAVLAEILRPEFRVVCAWCEEELRPAPPGGKAAATSHGICPSCAARYFGLALATG